LSRRRSFSSLGSGRPSQAQAAIAVVGAMLGAIYPGLKAARQDAIEALVYE
jgi:hypothetical protein